MNIHHQHSDCSILTSKYNVSLMFWFNSQILILSNCTTLHTVPTLSLHDPLIHIQSFFLFGNNRPSNTMLWLSLSQNMLNVFNFYGTHFICCVTKVFRYYLCFTHIPMFESHSSFLLSKFIYSTQIYIDLLSNCGECSHCQFHLFLSS